MSSRVAVLTTFALLGFAGRARAQGDAAADTPSAPPEPMVAPAAPVSAVVATPFTLDVGPLPVEFHGYATQGFAISDHNNYYTLNSNHGSLRFTEVAVNATAQVTERTRVVVQVATVINDRTATPQLMLDFGFVDYRFSDAIGIRLGRFRGLNGLYSEVWDTDIARVPIFMPTSVYDAEGRQMFMNAQGAQVYGSLRSQHAGSLDYAGNVGALSRFTTQGSDVDLKLNVTGRVIYNTPLDGLRVGGSLLYSDGRSSTDVGPIATLGLIQAGIVPPTFNGIIPSTIHSVWRGGAFAELALGGWTLAGEYARMKVDSTVNDPTFAAQAPPGPNSEDFYVLTSYRFTDFFTAGGYASFHFADVKNRDGKDPAAHTFDYAATLRFDVNSYLAFKTELHRIDGVSQLIADLNRAGSTSPNGWLFAVRASAAF